MQPVDINPRNSKLMGFGRQVYGCAFTFKPHFWRSKCLTNLIVENVLFVIIISLFGVGIRFTGRVVVFRIKILGTFVARAGTFPVVVGFTFFTLDVGI